MKEREEGRRDCNKSLQTLGYKSSYNYFINMYIVPVVQSRPQSGPLSLEERSFSHRSDLRWLVLLFADRWHEWPQLFFPGWIKESSIMLSTIIYTLTRFHGNLPSNPSERVHR